jgi:type I restriction enzyme S subunit
MADSGWTPARLGELVEIKHGWPFKSEYFDENLTGGPIVVSVGNFRYTGGFRFDETTLKEYRDTYPKEFELSSRDILLVMTCQTAGGEILGIPARVPNNGRLYLHNQRLGKVVIKDAGRVDADYLYWLFLWEEFNRELVTSASGTKILHTAPSRIEAFAFNLPPRREQEAIAHVLGALDDKIELNRQMNETLEAIARALFKSWFVDFDPVRIKVAGCDPGLPKPLADLFPDAFEDSELGEIPKGWKVRSLDEIARFMNGLALQKYPPREGRSLPVIKIAELRTDSTEGADTASADLEPEYIVQDGDVLFSWSGSLECVLWAGGTGALNQHLFKVTSTEYPKWLYYLWIHQHLEDFRHIAAGKATTMGHIQRHHLSDAKVVLPAAGLLLALDVLVGPLINGLWRRRVQSLTLASLRDTLLPRLISGELRIKDVEQFIPETSA